MAKRDNAAERLYRAWRDLQPYNATRDAQGAVGPARQLFVDWIKAGRRSYWEPAAIAPPNVRESFGVLRGMASQLTPAEIERFLELVAEKRQP